MDPENEESKPLLSRINSSSLLAEPIDSPLASTASEIIEIIPFIHKKSTNSQTTINSINSLLGIGLLSVPFAYSKLGWYLSLLLTPIFGLSCYFTATLASRYPKNIFTKTIFCLELFMASVAMIILFSDSISSLLNIQEYKTGFTIIAAVCLTPLTFMNLAFLSRMSFIGVASIMFLIFTLFWNVLVFGVRVEDTVTIPSRIEDIGLGIGLLFCGFDAHAVFPTIYHDMERPEHFKTAISTTYSFVTLVYATIGIVGYSAYASGILSEITLNFPLTGTSGILSRLTLFLITLNPLTKYPLVLMPVNLTVEEWFGITDPVKQSCLRIFISFLALICALWFPSFHVVMGLMGAGLSFMIAILIPVGFLLLQERELQPKYFFAYSSLFLFAIIGMVVGVYGVVVSSL